MPPSLSLWESKDTLSFIKNKEFFLKETREIPRFKEKCPGVSYEGRPLAVMSQKTFDRSKGHSFLRRGRDRLAQSDLTKRSDTE
jgi:hypothetical protein